MSTMSGYVTEPFRKIAAFVVEWDPEDHDGEREPWESIEATMDACWAKHLAAHNAQETMDPPTTERDHDPQTDRRRVVRWAWTLPTTVPRELASRCRESVLRYLTYDPASQS